MGAQYRKIVRSRKLAERSYLYFKYPSNGKSLEFYLPFMENIDIQESQRANYATYDLIGRAGSLYAYLGSKSREMTLRFNITLPNIVDYIHNVGLSNMFADNFKEVVLGINRAEEREKFLRSGSNDGITNSNYYKFNHYRQGKEDIKQLDSSFVDATDRKSGTRSFFEDIAKFFDVSQSKGFNKDFFGLLQNNGSDQKKGFLDVDTGEAVNYLMMWVNVIRTSVINNSKQTQYGPPMVYLNHGTMYNNIPCVCTNYSVKIQNNAGYELLSLAPRQVEVTMNLSETRVGNFDKYIPFSPIFGDNLTGWESVIEEVTNGGQGTMDPHNQLLRMIRNNKLDPEIEPIPPLPDGAVGGAESLALPTLTIEAEGGGFEPSL
jgi:hypothetical protein